VLAFVWGAVWGSFHNVVIVWGLGQRQSLVFPGSHCLSCGTPIKPWDNIPILSYLVLRGRCRACHERFSVRYFIVELLGALLALGLYARVVLPGCTEQEFWGRLATFIVYEKLAGFLVVVSAIDIESLLIPNRLTYPAIPLAMVLSFLLPLPSWWDGLVGAVAGYGIIWLIATIYALVRGRPGMGFGDAKLLAVIGAILGWRLLPLTLFLASLQGSIVGLLGAYLGSRFVRNGEQLGRVLAGEDPPPADANPARLRFAAVPFGPFLALAAIEVLFLGEIVGQAFTFVP